MPPPPNPVLPVGKLPGNLLGRLIARYTRPEPSVVVGPGTGHDAAVIRTGSGLLAVKTDPITFATGDAPAYLVDVNANDLACLGAVPRWMVVTALLPDGATTPDLVERLFRQLDEVCTLRGIALIGGHTEITAGMPRPILVGTLLGEVAPDRLIRPGGARPGDALLLTKALAIEGTALLARELGSTLARNVDSDVLRSAAALLDQPGISVLADASALLDTGGVTALHDPTEGGLAMGIREMARAAGCGATVVEDAIPVLAETRAIANALGLDPLGILASGSLLASAAPGAVGRLVSTGVDHGFAVAHIGEITGRGAPLLLRSGDGDRELPAFASDEVTRVM